MSQPEEDYRAVLDLLLKWQSSRWPWRRYIGRVVYHQELKCRDLMKQVQVDVDKRKKGKPSSLARRAERVMHTIVAVCFVALC